MARFLVEIDAIGGERIGGTTLGLVFGAGIVFRGAAHDAGFGSAGLLGDAMGDIVDRIITRHFLFLQEECGVRFAFGEDGDQYIGPRHLIAARALDVNHRALDDTLEPGRRLGFFRLRLDQ